MVSELVARVGLDQAAWLIAIAAVRVSGKVIALAAAAVPRLEPEPDEEDSEDKPKGSGAVLALPVDKLPPPPRAARLNEFVSFGEAEPPLPPSLRRCLGQLHGAGVRQSHRVHGAGPALHASSCAYRHQRPGANHSKHAAGSSRCVG
ncbi:hypothetical protein ACS0Y6_36525, partial [Burkholderia gladioli]